MFLFELDSPDPDTVRLVAVVNQLKDSIDKGQEKSDWTEEEFLSYLGDFGLNLSIDSTKYDGKSSILKLLAINKLLNVENFIIKFLTRVNNFVLLNIFSRDTINFWLVFFI
jgi:hypothetical protein